MKNYNYNKEIIEETKKVFQKHYEEPLTDNDALEIHTNLVGFFELLLKLDKKQRKEALYRALEETESNLRGPL